MAKLYVVIIFIIDKLSCLLKAYPIKTSKDFSSFSILEKCFKISYGEYICMNS